MVQFDDAVDHPLQKVAVVGQSFEKEIVVDGFLGGASADRKSVV